MAHNSEDNDSQGKPTDAITESETGQEARTSDLPLILKVEQVAEAMDIRPYSVMRWRTYVNSVKIGGFRYFLDELNPELTQESLPQTEEESITRWHRLFRLEDIMQLLGISEKTAQRLLENGTLTGRRIGERWYVTGERIRELFYPDWKFDPSSVPHEQMTIQEACTLLNITDRTMRRWRSSGKFHGVFIHNIQGQDIIDLHDLWEFLYAGSPEIQQQEPGDN